MAVNIDPISWWKMFASPGPSGATFTLCTWVLTDRLPGASNQNTIWWMDNFSAANPAHLVVANAAGSPRLEAWQNGSSRVAGPTLTLAEWVFGAYRCTAGTTLDLLWRFEGEGALSSGSGTTDTTPALLEMLMGADRGFTDAQCLDGAVRFMRYWNAALTDEEILAESASATVVRTTDIFGHWAFENITNDTDDSSGQGHGLEWNTGVGGAQANHADPDIELPSGADVEGSGTLDGGGTLTGTGVRGVVGAAAVDGGGSLAGTGVRGVVAAGEIDGGGDLDGSGVRGVIGGATVDGGGALTGSGVRGVVGGALLDGGGALAGSGHIGEDIQGSGILAGGGDLFGQGLVSTGSDEIWNDANMDFVPLCEPWPVTWCCELDLSAAPVTGAAVQAASEYLWALSGRQHGACEVLLRPCRTDCAERPSGLWWSGVAWPFAPNWASPWWRVDLACGQCQGHCSCTSVSTVRLPFVAQAITQVVIDGVTLPADAYAFYNGDTLVRADGEAWPTCQDWSVPVSGVGAWSVTARYGTPVPELGKIANGELACLIAKHCSDASCHLPPGLQSQTRAGSTYVYMDPATLKRGESTGLAMVDRFLDSVNPARIQSGPAKIWSPDAYGGTRVPGGVT